MSNDPPILPAGNKAGKRISIALAIAVHLILAGFLFYGVRWQTKATDVVEVELVRAMPQPVAVPPAPTVKPPPEPSPKIEPKPEPKPEPKIEPKIEPKPEPAPPPPKPDIVVKEKPKPPPKTKPVPRVDPFKEQLKREEEQLAQRKQADTDAQILNDLIASQATSARSKAMADYLGRIRAKIRGNIVLPPDVKGNPEAIFSVTQLPSGQIVTVRLKQSSGNTALDNAIERAILKSNPLPQPGQADLFDRSLDLRYRPLDK